MKLYKNRKEVIDMANLFFQGKLIRQFWGKLIRQSTTNPRTNISLQYVTWGGGSLLVD